MPALDKFYSEQISALSPIREPTEKSTTSTEPNDRLLVNAKDGKELGQLLDAPEIAMEVERAVFQIRHKLKSQDDSSKKKSN
jgi:hypothetical protein